MLASSLPILAPFPQILTPPKYWAKNFMCTLNVCLQGKIITVNLQVLRQQGLS